MEWMSNTIIRASQGCQVVILAIWGIVLFGKKLKNIINLPIVNNFCKFYWQPLLGFEWGNDVVLIEFLNARPVPDHGLCCSYTSNKSNIASLASGRVVVNVFRDWRIMVQAKVVCGYRAVRNGSKKTIAFNSGARPNHFIKSAPEGPHLEALGHTKPLHVNPVKPPDVFDIAFYRWADEFFITKNNLNWA